MSVYNIVRYLGAAIIAGLPHPRSISRYRLIDKNPRLLLKYHFFGLGLTVIGRGLGLGLMKCWSLSHTPWSHGLKSILCSSNVMTSNGVQCFVNIRI